MQIVCFSQTNIPKKKKKSSVSIIFNLKAILMKKIEMWYGSGNIFGPTNWCNVLNEPFMQVLTILWDLLRHIVYNINQA